MGFSGLVFLLVYFGGLLAALARGPIFGLASYMYVFYAHPPARWWGDEVPDLRFSLVASLITLVSAFMYKNSLSSPTRPSWTSFSIIKILIAYVLWMWVQTIWAISPDDHAYGRDLYTKFVVILVLIYLIINTEHRLKLFALAHVVGCFYLGWLAWESGDEGEGVGGPGINTSNGLSVFLTTGVMFASMLLLSEDKRIRAIAFFALPFILNGIILTGSRGGFLGLVAGGIALYVLSPASKKRQIKIYAMLGIVLFSVLAHDKFISRMETIFIDDAEQRDNSAESRFVIAKVQWKLFTSNPLGAGHRGTQAQSYRYLDERYLSGGSRSSHNTYLTVLVDQGLPGGILYLMLMWTAARMVFSIKSKLHHEMKNTELSLVNAAAGGSLVAVAVAGLFSSYWRMEITFWCFAILMILVSLIAQESSKLHIQPQPRGFGIAPT